MSKKKHEIRKNNPQNATTENQERTDLQQADKRVQTLLSLILVTVFGVFYFSRDLFQVNNLNDFGEYMLRAQDWVNGTFSMTGGSDVLLSAIEYLALVAHPSDFFAFYSLTITALTTIMLLASFIFLVRDNPLLPDNWVRLGMTAIFLSIPHFIIATRTVDQSLLFGACLLLFIATYDLPWAGFVGVITWFSRPEAIIIVPIYLIAYYLHRERRRQILYNFCGFVSILLLFVAFTSNTSTATAPSEYQQYSFIGKVDLGWFVNLSRHLLNIPAVITAYAMEALQSTALLLAFVVGLTVSFRQRSAMIMYAVVVTFCLAYAVFFADTEPKSYAYYYSVIRRMANEGDYFIVNAFNKFDSILSHGRYRLVLYPAFAFFVVNGLATLLRLFFRDSRNEKSRHGHAVLATSLIVALFFILARYPSPSKPYIAKTRIESIPSIMKVAMALRPYATSSAAVFIEGFCDNSRGSLMAEFAVFSGIRKFVLKVCPGSKYWQDGPEPVGSTEEYIRMHPFNSEAVMLFHDYTARRSEISDPIFCNRLISAVSSLDRNRLVKAGISLVISYRVLNEPHLYQVGMIDGIRYYLIK